MCLAVPHCFNNGRNDKNSVENVVVGKIGFVSLWDADLSVDCSRDTEEKSLARTILLFSFEGHFEVRLGFHDFLIANISSFLA